MGLLGAVAAGCGRERQGRYKEPGELLPNNITYSNRLGKKEDEVKRKKLVNTGYGGKKGLPVVEDKGGGMHTGETATGYIDRPAWRHPPSHL